MKKKTKKPERTWPKDAWKPRRRGAIYCSPACGANCTWAAYQQATREAALVCQLLGPNWKPYVRENCHWYWYAILDTGAGLVLSIIPFEHKGKVTFSAMLGSSPGCGSPEFHSMRHFKNPRNAVRHQMNLVRVYVKNVTKLETLLKGKLSS